LPCGRRQLTAGAALAAASAGKPSVSAACIKSTVSNTVCVLECVCSGASAPPCIQRGVHSAACMHHNTRTSSSAVNDTVCM
jgi:hypothetical protein